MSKFLIVFEETNVESVTPLISIFLIKCSRGVRQNPPRNDTMQATVMTSFALQDILLYLDNQYSIVRTPELFAISYCQHTAIATLI